MVLLLQRYKPWVQNNPWAPYPGTAEDRRPFLVLGRISKSDAIPESHITGTVPSEGGMKPLVFSLSGPSMVLPPAGYHRGVEDSKEDGSPANFLESMTIFKAGTPWHGSNLKDMIAPTAATVLPTPSPGFSLESLLACRPVEACPGLEARIQSSRQVSMGESGKG